MKAGFDASKGDVIVTMDGDLQNDPSDIPRLVKVLMDGEDSKKTVIRSRLTGKMYLQEHRCGDSLNTLVNLIECRIYRA